MQLLISTITLVSTLYWIVVVITTMRTIKGVPLLENLSPPDPDPKNNEWPRVAVIVPACNEEESIDQAMRSRMTEDYPNAEYILVNDRSTDRTGEIIDKLAAEEPDRVTALHIRELPEGWLGKLNAMQVAVEHVEAADFILFSDADVHHEPGVLRKIIAHCEEHNIDHVSVFPSVWSSTFWLDAVLNVVLRMLIVIGRAWKVADPKSRVSLGGGNFNLVRRSALDRAGGLAPLKLEVLDDAALGQILKWSGAHSVVLNARGGIGLWFYRSIGEAVRGMEKNGFAAIGRFSYVRHVVALMGVAIVDLGVFVTLTQASGWALIVSAIAVTGAIGSQLWSARWLGRPMLPSLVAPFGMIVLLIAAMRSMLLALIRGGVEWRGTRYPLALLRRGMSYVHV